MGIQINGQTDTISASDGGLSVSGMELSSVTSINASGIGTFSNGPVLIGSATSTGTTTQRLQVTGGAYVSGSVGIGTTNPTQRLELGGSAYTALDIKSTGGIISRIVSNDSSSSLDIGTLSNNVINFYTSNSFRGRFDTSGNVQIANGNLVFSTAGTGIDFSATTNSSGTMSSELLSDYEEGTWTPTLPGGGSLTTLTATYTRIGRFVSVFAYMSAISPTNDATLFQIGGLPYTCLGSNNFHTGSIGYVGAGNLNGWVPIVASGGTYIYFHVTTGNAASRTNANFVSVNNGGPMLFNVAYYTS